VGHRVVICLLLNKAIDINIVYSDGYTLLIKAVALEQDAVVQLLLKKGADITMRTNAGETALLAAAKNGYRGLV
jgi:ankyrin repeat protein